MYYQDKYFLLAFFSRLVTLLTILCAASPVFSDDKVSEQQGVTHTNTFRVVTTFSVLADMVKQIGGEHVSVHTLVDWDEDAHVFQPTPDDVKKISGADLLVLNGLGFEGWLARLTVAASYQGPTIEVTKGVDLISLNLKADDHHHHHHDSHGSHHKENMYDPHAWHSLNAASVYIDNITQALINIDPTNRSYYESKQTSFKQELVALDNSISSQLDRVVDNQKRIVVPHNAFAYLARDYGLYIHSLQGLSTESEASAADLAKIVRLIRKMNIRAMFTETTSDKRLIKVVESETDANIEGALVSGALSKTLAPTYLEMMSYNSQLIISALTKQ